MGKVFLNDQILDAEKARLKIDDSSFLYGIGLFETMRAVGGKVFRLDDHVNRLLLSARALAVYNSYSADKIKEAVEQVLETNKLTEARMRLTLTNGSLSSEQTPHSTLLVTAAQFVPYPEEYYKKGVRVVITDSRQNSKDPFAGHKTTCYGPRLTVLRQAHEKLATEAIWFTTENHLAEGCISNIFLVKDDTLLTPPETTPVLPGIARKTILEIAQDQKISFEERPLDINDLLNAEEVFLTNVVMTVLPVTGIEAHTVADAKPGKITKMLTEKYEEKLNA